LYAKLGLTDSDTKSNEEVPPVVKSGVQDKGQARPNPGVQDKGQAGPNPGDNAEPQPQSTHVVHAGPNLEHMDFEATDASNQPHPEQMDEGSIGTLSSLQHLAKDFSFGNQFFNDKPSKAENEKTTAETEAELMVSVTIHQDTSVIPLMTSCYLNKHTTTTIITTLPLPPQPQQGSSDSILIQRIGELEQHMADLVQANLALEERMDKHGSRLYKLENLDIPPSAHEDYKKLYEALEKSMDHDHTHHLLTDLAEARKKKKTRHDSPKTPPGSPPHQPPPPPPLAGPSGTSGTSRASGSSQLPPPHPPPSTNQSDQSASTAAQSSSKTAASAEYMT
ncbi:hypothetical protein Tco_1397637, partial [Tanacetum coccineum]